MMDTRITPSQNPYQRALSASKKARFDLDRDVFRGRHLEADRKFLPDGLSRLEGLSMLNAVERRLLSQIQGRTYANIFGLVERFINAKVLEVGREHALGDQVALEALVRFSEEELKHQEMFRRLEVMAEGIMPAGYRSVADPDEVARVVLGKSTWAVLALTCHIELFTQVHYKESIEPDPELSPLYKDVFLYHFMEESQHAALDELEWRRCDQKLGGADRDHGVTDLIELVAAVDGVLQAQSTADAEYFFLVSNRAFSSQERATIARAVSSAYRYQYIVSGVHKTRFASILTELLDAPQWARIEQALAPLL